MARSKGAQKRRSDIRAFLNWLKDTRGCGECGMVYPGEPYLLELDHHDTATKRFNPSHMVRCLYSWESVIAEVAKTAIRCVVCHKRRTHSGTGLAEDECMGAEAVKVALEEWRRGREE